MISLPSLMQANEPEDYKHVLTINAPVSGELVAMNSLADPLLQAGLWGEGVAIRTRSMQCYSPIAGRVNKLDIGQQRWIVKSNNGLKLAIQIGPVTQPVFGERLKVLKRDNTKVDKGECLTYFDPLFLTQKWGHCYVIMTVMNKKGIRALMVEPNASKVTPESPVLRIYI